MGVRRSVLVIRPYSSACRTAAALKKRGFAPFIVPLSAIRPVHANLPDKNYEAVIATSANAFLQPLLSHATFIATRFAALPLYCVGHRTAHAARERGFTAVTAVAENIDRLCAEIAVAEHRRFIYLAGRLRRPGLENRLRDMEIEVDSVELYETQLLTPSAAQCADLPPAIDFILLYSAASVRMLGSLASFITAATRILCLSPRIAAALPRRLQRQAMAACKPTEQALFSLLYLP